LLSDTVGFIDRLPHQLVAAFHATLEEVIGADLLLHVIDAAAPDRDRRAQAVHAVLVEIGAEHVPIVEVLNKIDLLDAGDLARLLASHPGAVAISAARGTGRDELVDVVAGQIAMDVERVSLKLDGRLDADKRLVGDLYRHARVVSHLVAGDRISIEADVPKRLMKRVLRAGAVA
jgi:GTP-binding protein HflX